MRNPLVLSLLVIVFVVSWHIFPTYADEEGAVSDVSQEASGDTVSPGFESENIYEVNAALSLGLEYNDNIDEEAHNKTSDMIAHVRPSFGFRRIGGRIGADIDYRGDYLFYLQGNDTEEYRHYIDATVTGELVQNLLFLSVNENMQQVYHDISRGAVGDDETTNDLVNRNRFTVSPHFRLRPSERTRLLIGYDFTDVRYSKGLDDDENPRPVSFNRDQYNFNSKKSQRHTAYVELDHEVSDRAVMFTGGSMTRWIDDNEENLTDQSFYRYIAYIGGSYAFSEDLSVRVKAGPSVSVPDEYSTETRPFVEAELTYTIGRSRFNTFYMTTYEDDADTGGSTQKSQYGIQWEKMFDRSRLSVAFSYNTYENEVDTDRRIQGNGDTYAPSLRYTYDLSDRLSAFIGYSATLYEDHAKGDHRHEGRYGITYELSGKDRLGLSHSIKYTDVYENDSYSVNRVMFDFTHIF
ncbi:TIGR03016 family PEP-CTERM system-associated outer membrane protein [Desulfosarcina sp. OttesenSCG-928-G10]|nr:TIGR03016 family PEP-CTERM system-associated outer membrane protein [Desulfosarcina sp. OttesenSCG-928-G10]